MREPIRADRLQFPTYPKLASSPHGANGNGRHDLTSAVAGTKATKTEEGRLNWVERCPRDRPSREGETRELRVRPLQLVRGTFVVGPRRGLNRCGGSSYSRAIRSKDQVRLPISARITAPTIKKTWAVHGAMPPGGGLSAKASVAIDGNNFKAVNKHPATGHDFADRKTLYPRSRCVKCRTE